MRILLLVIAFILSLHVHAQKNSRFQLGFNGMGSFAKIESSQMRGSGVMAGGGVQFKMVGDFRFFQIGAGLDCTAMGGKTELLAYRPWGHPSNKVDTFTTDASTMLMRITPFVFANAKVDIGNTYLYAGAHVGMGSTPSRWDDMFAGVYGLQAGFVVKLNKMLDLEVAESWRRMTLKDMYYENSSVQLVTYFQPATVNYFTTHIGIRLKFERPSGERS